MKQSEIKEGHFYLCPNGDYRKVEFFCSNPNSSRYHYESPVELAYAKFTKDKSGAMIRTRWIHRFCTIKHFTRSVLCEVVPRKRTKRDPTSTLRPKSMSYPLIEGMLVGKK